MSKRDIDKHFPRNGPCFMHPTRYARHRLIDAIRSRRRAGESIADLADDFALPISAIRAAIRSTPNDKGMTAKEIREGREMLRKAGGEFMAS